MIAKLAYLTTPAPNRFILNFQFVDSLGNEVLAQFEISKAHLANLIIDGTSLALREAFVHHRVPETASPENAEHERADNGA